MTSVRASSIGCFFAAVRVLQLLTALATIPLLSLFAVRTSRRHVPAPFQLVFSLVVSLLSVIHTTTTFLIHLCAALHYRTVLALDLFFVLLFAAASILLGLPLAHLSCAAVPSGSTLPHASSPRFLSAPALSPERAGDYKWWVHHVRAVCELSQWAWYGALALGGLYIVSAACAAKMSGWWKSQHREMEGSEMEEEFMPVVPTPELDRVLCEGEERSLGEEIERGLEWRYREDGGGAVSPGLGAERGVSQEV